jgi:hypothetical protein
MRPLRFSTLEAAHAYAGRMSRQESRIVWVRGDGWRRTMDAGET